MKLREHLGSLLPSVPSLSWQTSDGLNRRTDLRDRKEPFLTVSCLSPVSNRFVSLLTVSFSQDVAAKIHGMLKQHKLRRVFLATDSPDPRVFEDILREQVSESLLLLLLLLR